MEQQSYFNDRIGSMYTLRPFLYVNMDEMYVLNADSSAYKLKDFDNVKVEVTGKLNSSFNILDIETIVKV